MEGSRPLGVRVWTPSSSVASRRRGVRTVEWWLATLRRPRGTRGSWVVTSGEDIRPVHQPFDRDHVRVDCLEVVVAFQVGRFERVCSSFARTEFGRSTRARLVRREDFTPPSSQSAGRESSPSNASEVSPRIGRRITRRRGGAETERRTSASPRETSYVEHVAPSGGEDSDAQRSPSAGGGRREAGGRSTTETLRARRLLRVLCTT